MGFHHRTVALLGLLFLGVMFVFPIPPLPAQVGSLYAPVPLDLAKFAAIHYAKQFYGEMEFYSEITYYDPETEQPSVYAIILKTPGSEKADLAQLKQGISSGQTAIKTLEGQVAEVETLDLSGKKKAERLAKLRAEIRTIRKEMAGTDRFATFLCGATEDHVPVIRAHRGLPEHMLVLPLIQVLKESEPELQGKTIGRILYLGMFDQAYVLQFPSTENYENQSDQSSGAGQNGYAVSVRGLRVEKLTDLRNAIAIHRAKVEETQTQTLNDDQKNALAQRREERRQAIANKWEALKRDFARGSRQ